MDRTEASIAPARGGDRTDGRARWRMRAGLPLAGICLTVGTCWPAPTAGAAGTSHGSHRSGPSEPTLTLLAPPTVAGPSSPFAVRLGVSGSVAHTDLTLGVTVYGPVSTLTAFNETLGGATVGPVLAGPRTVAVSSLPADTSAGQGGVDLTVPVGAGDAAGTGTGPFTVDLRCQPGSCGGVYPVELELTDSASHAVTSRLITYLVYTDPSADFEPLRFALVLPLGLTPSSSTAGAGAVTSSSLAALTKTLDAVSGPRSAVPLTLAPNPATVVALGADRGARSKAALGSLLSVTADPGRQTVCGGYVPVNANALVNSVLGSTELAEQVRRGAEVLDGIPGLPTGCATENAWVADGTLDTAALGALGSLGYSDFVVPPGAVAGPTPATTPTRRFTFEGARSGTAILSDPGLSARLQATAHADPALAADQLLAELEFDYYEAPNTPNGRGVVAAPPADAPADPTVVALLLDGLENNAMVKPVTLATLFSDVPVGGVVGRFTQPSPRRPAAVTGGSALPARAIASARSQWAGFSAAVAGNPAGTGVAAGLNDLLLGSESEQLTPAQQRAGVGRFEDALARQLAQLSIASREVRLTARTGSVPITVIKSTPYPVEAVLTVTSDKIAFSAGTAQVPNTECRTPVVTNVAGRSSVATQCTFVHDTNAVYIEMRSRVSGDFRMSVTLNSPQAGLQLAAGQLTVRSMSTSAVAIALSAAAVVVLLGWWGRTVWRSRRNRRGAHRRGASRS